jgi:hypothetical protein
VGIVAEGASVKAIGTLALNCLLVGRGSVRLGDELQSVDPGIAYAPPPRAVPVRFEVSASWLDFRNTHL